MIDNSDKFGHFWVIIRANKNQVAGFQCPTIEDAKSEAARIVAYRNGLGLPVGKATVAECVGVNPPAYGDRHDPDIFFQPRKGQR